MDFGIRIPAIEHAREIKQLRALVDLSPESFLELFFGLALSAKFLDEVEMSEDADNFGESMGLKYIQKFKRFLPTK